MAGLTALLRAAAALKQGPFAGHTARLRKAVQRAQQGLQIRQPLVDEDPFHALGNSVKLLASTTPVALPG